MNFGVCVCVRLSFYCSKKQTIVKLRSISDNTDVIPISLTPKSINKPKLTLKLNH